MVLLPPLVVACRCRLSSFWKISTSFKPVTSLTTKRSKGSEAALLSRDCEASLAALRNKAVVQMLGKVMLVPPARARSRSLISAQLRLGLPETSRFCRLVREPRSFNLLMLLPEISRSVRLNRLPNAVTLAMPFPDKSNFCKAVNASSRLMSASPVFSRSNSVRFNNELMTVRSAIGLPDTSSCFNVRLFNNSLTLVSPEFSKLSCCNAVSRLISFRSDRVTPVQVKPVTLPRLPV